MQGRGYIESVETLNDCAVICHYVENCAYVSFRKTNNRCYLKTVDAPKVSSIQKKLTYICTKGIQYDQDYDSAPAAVSHCDYDDYYSSYPTNCVLKPPENEVKTNIEYANGYFMRYDIIPRNPEGYIPGWLN